MSMATHRCKTCSHLQHYHDGGSCSLGTCRCDASKFDPAPAELIPTFDASGQPVERVIPPGDGIYSEAGKVLIRACGCQECVELAAS
jgi:hypothetical protein